MNRRDLPASPNTDPGWLAKVLAGDPVACGVLVLARNLPDAELDALISRVEQMGRRCRRTHRRRGRI